MNDALYTLHNVSRRYGRRQVLAVAELNILRGEILAIVGPSGAGKSTLLRLLGFLESPSEGRLTFEGSAICDEPPLPVRRRVTTMLQAPRLLNRSVADNVRYGVALRGRKLEPSRLEHWLGSLGLTALARQLAAQLSAGEAQRVALARALALQPDVLLLDEPTASLDPANVGLVESLLREEHRRRSATIVLVTHNVFQARRLAHRVGLLLDGRLVELAATADFFDRPADPLTAAFVRGEFVC